MVLWLRAGVVIEKKIFFKMGKIKAVFVPCFWSPFAS